MEKFLGALALIGILLLMAGAIPVGGMYFAASGLTLLSLAAFTLAKGGIHEVAAAVLLVGAFLCIGFGNLARVLRDVETVAAHFSRKLGQSEPKPRETEPTQKPQPESPPRNIAEARERAFGTIARE
jgi:hypothetical protein